MMKIKIELRQRASDAWAEAVFEDGSVTVLPGGKISETFAEHIRGGRKAKSYRDNPEYVDCDRNIVKKCIFSSPSTAAQFVTGRSTNGYVAWKADGGKNLGEVLKAKGLRE